MSKYRKKPVVIEAFRLFERLPYPYEPEWFMRAVYNGNILPTWKPTSAFGTIDPLRQRYVASCDINTLEGVMHANEGDFIIQGVNGEIYPCKPDIFAKTYEPAEEENHGTRIDA